MCALIAEWKQLESGGSCSALGHRFRCYGFTASAVRLIIILLNPFASILSSNSNYFYSTLQLDYANGAHCAQRINILCISHFVHNEQKIFSSAYCDTHTPLATEPRIAAANQIHYRVEMWWSIDMENWCPKNKWRVCAGGARVCVLWLRWIGVWAQRR